MSATQTEKRQSGLKGKRVPGRPGRFDPTEPLHMTTRNRAKGSTANGTPSVNGSLEDGSGRRGSMDDFRPTTSHSQRSQPSPNGVHVSDVAETPSNLENEMTEAPSSGENGFIRSLSKALLSPGDASPTSRKRKRSSPSPPSTAHGLFVTPAPQQLAEASYMDERDEVELVPASQESNRQVSGSTSPSGQDQLEENGGLAAASFNDSPIATAQVSPASSVSGPAEAANYKNVNGVLDEGPQRADAVANEDVDEIDNGDEVDDLGRSDEEGRPIKRIGGKRRRARHPDDLVEGALRRQLELRRGFRTIAKHLKECLDEIAERTVEELKNDSNSARNAAEHEEVQAKLDLALERRQAFLKTKSQLDMQLLHDRLQAEQDVCRSRHKLQWQKAQDEMIDRLEYEMLAIERAAQLHADLEANETEDEDDIIPKLKRASYRFHRGDALEPAYESRSRIGLATETASEDQRKRLAMGKMLQEFIARDDEHEALTGFTIMDQTIREATVARRETDANIGTLASAAAEVERVANIPVIPNEDAIGLQLLGDLATRPSLNFAAHEVAPVHSSRGSSIAQTPHQYHPQPIFPPPPQEHIAVELSPKTAQLVRDHFHNTMPPPRTPREGNVAFGFSPSSARPEVPHPSHSRHADRPNGLPAIAAKPPNADSHSESEPSPFFAQRHPFRPQEASENFFDGLRERESRQNHGSPVRRDDFHPRPGMPDRRSRSMDEQFSPVPLYRAPQRERHDAFTADYRRGDPRPDSRRQDFWAHDRLHDRPRDLARPRSPGFRDDRPRTRPGLQVDVSGSFPPRRPSIDFKMESPVDGSQLGEHKPRTLPDGRIKKSNKAERGGAPRRRRKPNNIDKHRHYSNESVATDGPPRGIEDPLGRDEDTQPPTRQPQWQHPPAHRSAMPPPSPAEQSALPPPPPLDATQPRPAQYGQHPDQYRLQPQSSFFPLPRALVQDWPPEQHRHQHQHRNSFPPQQNTPSSWPPALSHFPPRLPPSVAPPPPPGVPPDQFLSRLPFLQPPPPAPTLSQYQAQGPATQPPPSATGSYAQQYGGPTIAPAGHGYRGPGSGSSPHQPAFAQAQKQQDGQRRRTQSDAFNSGGNRRPWLEYQPNRRP